MVKVLHTADWQLGMRASGLGQAGAKVREARFDTASAIMELAKQREVDFILIAGDLFEDNGVSNGTIYRAAETLKAAAPVPVFIIPGNHDPATADTVYDRPAWASEVPDNVLVLREREPVELEELNVVLYPCPLTQKLSTADPTTWIAERDFDGRDVIRVGLAHGALDIHNKQYNFPIAPDRAETAALGYLALGDWHKMYTHDARTAYSGTPEQTDFGEEGTGNVLLVEIAGKGDEPKIEEVHVARLAWLKWEAEAASGTVGQLRQRVRDLDDPEHTLLRLALRGAVAPETQKELEALREFASSRLLRFELDDSSVSLMLEPDGIREALRPGALRDVCDVLLSLRRGGDMAEPTDAESVRTVMQDLPEEVCRDDTVIERALQILCELSQTSE
jgi:DNA repair exonuclease SbcCD nuclease subunit